jgi:AmmeMemoRadiSam system protein B
MRTRNPAVEGRFYPSSKDQIFKQIRDMEKRHLYPEILIDPIRIFGAVLPHAGHLYSGHQTIPFFHLLNKMELYPDTFVIVHPNHSGKGSELAIDDSDFWGNSIGEVPIDREFAKALGLPFDRLAHSREHSAEVIIPFLQYFFPSFPFSIVPICMLDQSYDSASRVADQIGKAVALTNRQVMVIASSDFSHFLAPEEGESRDQLVLQEIFGRNAPGIEEIVKQHQVSVCGYGPIMALMQYSEALNSNYQARILARGHSGEVIPSREVVDYISLIMYQ